MRRPLLPLCVLFALAGPAWGQQAAPAAPGPGGATTSAPGKSDALAPDAAAPPTPAPPAPYEGPLLRLSELMGALHYLRGLCGNSDAGIWRDRMTALIESESGDEARRSRLAGAFNRGYRTYQQTYHTCNESALAAIKNYVAEGQQITRDIGTRFAD